MPSLSAYILVFCAVSAIVAGQVLFKRVAILMGDRPMSEVLQNAPALAHFVAAISIYGAASVLWIIALRHLALSRSYMFMAVAFIAVPLISKVLFGEELSKFFWVGAAFITLGVYLTNVP